VYSFLHSLLKFYSKQKFVRFCYLVVFISTLLFFTVLPGFVVKNNAVQYCSLRWVKSHEIVIKMLRVEKVGAYAAFWENLWAKADQIESRSTDQKRGLCWITNWHSFIGQGIVRTTVSEIPSQYETYTWGYTWRPLACYPFINIKLAAYHCCCFM